MMQETKRYLKKVHIRNFQSHRNTEVNLKPGINLIVGTSDVGKSAFMRALNLVMHNEVPNREFVTYGEKDATVILEFSDGTIVERVKGANKNAYYATLPDGTTIEKEKLGNTSSIPEEIYKALGSPPVDKRYGNLAYAEQLSPLFLVSLSTTELPRCISELTGLDDYENAAMSLAKSARQFDRKIKETKSRITGFEASMSQYQGLDNELSAYETLIELIEQAESIHNQIEDSENLIAEYKSIIEQGRQIIAEMSQHKSMLNIQDDVKKAQTLESNIDNIVEITSDYHRICNQIDSLDNELESAKMMLNTSMIQNLNKCSELEKTIKLGFECLNEYNQVLKNGKETSQEIQMATDELNEQKQKQENMINSFTEQGLICPECKQPMAVTS